MPSIVHQHDLEEFEDSDDRDGPLNQQFKVTSPEGTEEVYSPDEAFDLISDLLTEQFWEWVENPNRSRRFKPRIKVYEVW
jgi:hypothetical protein